MQVKREIRVLGVDDAPFKKTDRHVLVVGTVFRGGEWLDGLLSTKVAVDGTDATEKLVAMAKRSKHFGQLNCVIVDGIALGGFNVIDIKNLAKETKLPVIVVIRRPPNFADIKAALAKTKATYKLKLMKAAGKIRKAKVRDKFVYFQCAGIEHRKAADIIRLTATRALLPEPIRAAHIIASGIVLGESRGRA